MAVKISRLITRLLTGVPGMMLHERGDIAALEPVFRQVSRQGDASVEFVFHR